MIEAIYDRISVRTYEKVQLDQEARAQISEILQKNQDKVGPFGHKINYFSEYVKSDFDDESKKIGTYGFIKNAPGFVGGTILNTLEGIVDFGYLFEIVILKLTQAGFGTCWLGGTFQRQALKEYTKEGMIIPAITPVGYPEDKMSLAERAIRFSIKADRRKHFHEMFYEKDIHHPLKDQAKDEHPLGRILELIQLGPSASNKQPWRVILDQNSMHIYLERTPNYATSLPFVMQALDIGIALAHAEVGFKHEGYDIVMLMKEHPSVTEWDYIISIDYKK